MFLLIVYSVYSASSYFRAMPSPADGLPGNNNSLHVRHITAADAFPCAVVEEEDLFCYLLKMLQRPADKGGDVRHEGLTAGGEAVLNSRRHFGINLPADKPYLFKPFERLREHLLRTIGHITV